MSLMLERTLSVSDLPPDASLRFSDFTNGWPSGNTTTGSVLQNALDTCGLETGGAVDGECESMEKGWEGKSERKDVACFGSRSGLTDFFHPSILSACAAFVPYIDRNAAAACSPENQVVNEDIGWGKPVSALPGNNLIWIGNSTTKVSISYPSHLPDFELMPGCFVPQPVAANYTFSGGYTTTSSVLPTGWSNLGCIAEASSGRALVSANTNAANMTLAVCAAYCGG